MTTGTAASLHRRVIPADGVDLACWHRPGDGRRWILWLHGACGNHLMWHRQFGAFPGADLLFLDVRGQGESPMHTGERTSFRAAVDDIGVVLDAYAVDRAVLVGHSWGGNPAQEFTYRHPDRVEGLVLVGTWGQHRPFSPVEQRSIRAMTALYRVLPWRPVSSYCGRACSSVAETRAAVTESVRSTGRQVFLDLGLSAYRDVREVDGYPAPTPMLLVRGEHDAPKHLEAIYDGLCVKHPAARQVVIAATGHQPMMDTPDEFNSLITELLGELP